MIKYRLTADGVSAFLEDVWGDVLKALEKDRLDDCDIFITIGNRELWIPITAQILETVENAVNECLNEWEG